MTPRLLIVGDTLPTHVGAHLLEAAKQLEVDVEICDAREAYRGPWLRRKLAWRMAGHRPARLAAFSARVIDAVTASRPDIVLATGLAPLTASALATIGRMGIRRLNFLTDDPWNPAHAAPWFRRALPEYDVRCFTAMRYWHPFAGAVAREVRDWRPDEVVLLPLYPQYSTTTTGSSLTDWRKAAAKVGPSFQASLFVTVSPSGW